MDQPTWTRLSGQTCGVAALLCAFLLKGATVAELTVSDLDFDGPHGSDIVGVTHTGTNRFSVELGYHGNASDVLQFQIVGGASGNTLKVTGISGGGPYNPFGTHSSWSYDMLNWQPIRYDGTNTVTFPEFTRDTVYFGYAVPFCYEDMLRLVADWRQHPAVTVDTVGASMEGRLLLRLVITDPQSPYPIESRWGLYVANQHAAEGPARWRIAGMIDWLLSDDAADCRQRTVCHFVVMMNPDAFTHGWRRSYSDGRDANRTYRVEGAHPSQGHEAYQWQADFEQIMASSAPIDQIWSMHSCNGGTILMPVASGPEMGTLVGTMQEFVDHIRSYGGIEWWNGHYGSTENVKWAEGPHFQFGITAILCEGGYGVDAKYVHVRDGRVIMQSFAQFYAGLRDGAVHARPAAERMGLPGVSGTGTSARRAFTVQGRSLGARRTGSDGAAGVVLEHGPHHDGHVGVHPAGLSVRRP